MRIKYLAMATMLSALLPMQAVAHQRYYDHSHDNSVGLAILGGVVTGGLLWTIQNHNHPDMYHPHHPRRIRRRHRTRIVDEYRYRGNNYRVCRKGGKVFYC